MPAAARTNDPFEDIGNEVLAAAARVPCGIGAYQDGLKTILHLVETALQASIEMDIVEGETHADEEED